MSIQDEMLAGKVKNAIAQDKRIGGQAIAVRVAQGDVFLKGVVDEEDQRDLAVMMAKGVAGVRHISIDELRVKGAAEE